jgi:hypothetical protein
MNGLQDTDTYERFIKILQEFISDSKRNKKTILSREEFLFIIKANTQNNYLQERYSIPKFDDKGNIKHKQDGSVEYSYICRNRVKDYYVWEIIENAVSVDGKMLSKIIEFFKPVSEQITQSEQTKTLKISQ